MSIFPITRMEEAAGLPGIRDARALTKQRRLAGAVVIGFAEDGRLSISSYGSTKARCAALRKLNDAISDLIDADTVDLSAITNDG